MSRTTRLSAVLALALAGSAAPALAQIPGMPLFTNPRYGTGVRVHLDAGKPTEEDPSGADLTVVQGGVTFALGPIGLGANVGMSKVNAENASTCQSNPTLDCAGQKITASVLAQLRIAGGGRSNLSLSLFGGASTDIDSADAAAGNVEKEMNIPVGIAVGLRVPLGLGSLNLWGAPRYSFRRFADCTGTCQQPDPVFGWAVGADLPIFRVLSVRAAFDSHKPDGATQAVNVIGVGVSLGIGGMR